jgi:hypothetical protein
MNYTEYRGKLWYKIVPNGRMWHMYVEHWRKPDGYLYVSPYGIPWMSLTFKMEELIEL